MIVLGIHSGVTLNQHDPNAALVRDGHVIAASEEERFLRIKGARGHLCLNSIRHCLNVADITIRDVDLVVHPGSTYEDMPGRISAYLIHHFGHAPEIRMVNHQLAHISGAYHSSGFERAMCVSYDGYGDRLSGAIAIGESGNIEIVDELPHENSLGTFYATLTSYLGFTPEEDEYKVMGLAAYGRPGVDLSDIAHPTEDGYVVNEKLLCRGDVKSPSMFEPYYHEAIIERFGPPRRPFEDLEQRHFDIAFAVQSTLEQCAVSLIKAYFKRCKISELCLSGGVALNCVANHAISSLPFIEKLFVLPPASDRGLALGCAFEGMKDLGISIQSPATMYLGPSYTEDAIYRDLQDTGMRFEKVPDAPGLAAAMIAEGKIIGWFQGRSEYGPRALGNRSILADPRNSNMKDTVNERIKFRENFRPFAPAVIEERASEVFEMSRPSPYMTVAFPVRGEWRDRIAAVTHIDGTARVQTVAKNDNQEFHQLIESFSELTDVPVVLNTSFNLRGEPIVETPRDALRTFSASGIDALFIGNFLITKSGKDTQKLDNRAAPEEEADG